MADNVGYCSLEACVIATYGIDDHDEKTSLLTELARLRAAEEFKKKVEALAADCGPLDSTTNLIDFGDQVQDLLKDSSHD